MTLGQLHAPFAGQVWHVRRATGGGELRSSGATQSLHFVNAEVRDRGLLAALLRVGG